MIEKYHYKGCFEFYYYATNQKEILKSFLKEAVPPEVRKAAKKKPWASYSDQEQRKLIAKWKGVLQHCSPRFVAVLLDPQDPVNKVVTDPLEQAVSLFHIINLALDVIARPEYFNVKDDLAIQVLTQALESF